MLKQTEITKEDVQQVADQLGYIPTPKEIQKVIEIYPSEQEVDPSGGFNLVIEQCLSSIGVYQSPKKLLVYKAIERIKKDVAIGDVTAIDELLNMLSNHTLRGYLSED